MNNLVYGIKSKLIVGGTLLASFATMPLAANAQVLGTGTNGNITIFSSANWTPLLALNVPARSTTRTCMVVGSLEALNPNGNNSGANAGQTYLFTVTANNSNPVTNGRAERSIEMRDQSGVNDPNFWPVSTNDTFVLAANASHTIRLLGRKADANAPNMVIGDSTLSIACI
ncbi:MAG: hypothetical protein KME17_01925 [Cyanosarcina radialis HA8281-LM2]|jgi:hypothetical protein|nr:hypothetical protein [Cyanosarcina radialis HA8281-LM2]